MKAGQALHHYWLNGFRVRSSLVIPGLREVRDGGEPDLVVTICPPTQTADEHGAGWDRDGAFAINVGGIGRFVIRDGRRICVEPRTAATDDEIRHYLLGSTFAAVAHQSGKLPLHASAVRMGDGCVAFTGPSGAGKSTICTMLARRGHEVVADDMCVIDRSSRGELQIHTGASSTRLLADTLQVLGVGREERLGKGTCFGKQRLVLRRAGGGRALPLRSVYALTEGSPGGAELSSTEGMESLRLIWDNVYKVSHAIALSRGNHAFGLTANLCEEIEVCRLIRPKDFSVADTVLNMIEARWSVPGSVTSG